MKRIKFLLVVFPILWGCSNLDQNFDQEDVSPEAQVYIDPQLSLPYRVLSLECDMFVFKFIKNIYDENEIGRKLIKKLDYPIGWITFVVSPDIVQRGVMLYAGGGYIYTNVEG